MKLFQIFNGDSLVVLQALPENSIDSVVCDPPYGLSFMGKRWDYDVPSVELWGQCFRVLKPGGHLLAFAGTRTQHRMAVRIEDAGFEIRDMIAWVYGSGFPKSLDISKAIDKIEGHWRGKAGIAKTENTAMSGVNYERTPKGDPVTAAAAIWGGWGTALKPALEPITVARKPLIGTVADNVLKYGTGGINIGACRVALEGEEPPTGSAKRVFAKNEFATDSNYGDNKQTPEEGRFPANFIHDGSEEVVALFPNTKSGKMKQRIEGGDFTVYGKQYPRDVETVGDSGSAARFFYCAKTSKSEREAGLQGFDLKKGGIKNDSGRGFSETDPNKEILPRNNHPTVKPIALMRYLCRLVTPPGGLVLDPFAGSGSTLCGAMLEGFDAIGIEREADYVKIAEARIKHNGGTENDIVDTLNLLY